MAAMVSGLAWSQARPPVRPPGTQAPQAPQAAAERMQLRIVGGLAGVNQYTRHEAPFWTEELPRRTQGRYSAEIVPFDRAGIRGQEMLQLMRIGAVPFGTALLSLSAPQDPVIAAPDLTGLNPDIATLKRNVAAFRPFLEKSLRERGIEVLAIYTYPAQVVFCNKPFAGLSDLAGRRVRVASATQSDLIEALGGRPVTTSFAEILPNLKSGNLECAVTGTMSGNTIGLHEVTTHVHTMALNWGLAIFGANRAAWQHLPADLRALLQQELPKLEAAIWAESERETGEGIACNTGNGACSGGKRGRMVEVRSSAADEVKRREIFASTVLPRWVQRCGPTCADTWNQTIGAQLGIAAPAR
jgi:TRAP-type C4-dicarboxylate transport system substrate-binding protein